MVFNRPIKIDDKRQILPKTAVGVASRLAGISPVPGFQFFEITSPSRDPDILTTNDRTLGFVRAGTIYLRSDLLANSTQLTKTAFHEVSHVREIMRASQTLELLYSLEASEREARLFVYENLLDLPSNAKHDECLLFLNQLEKLHSDRLRKKFAPVLKQISERYASTLQGGGLKIPGIQVEYR